jgi:hypothetical protein
LSYFEHVGSLFINGLEFFLRLLSWWSACVFGKEIDGLALELFLLVLLYFAIDVFRLQLVIAQSVILKLRSWQEISGFGLSWLSIGW